MAEVASIALKEVNSSSLDYLRKRRKLWLMQHLANGRNLLTAVEPVLL